MHGQQNVTSEVFILINTQAFVPLLYFVKSAKQANLVSETYQCCLKFPLVRADRPRQRILFFAEKLPCYPAVLRATNAGKQNTLLMLRPFSISVLFFRCRCPFNSLLLSHLLFHFYQQFCIIFLMQKV